MNSSSDSICLFGVELSYGCFDKDRNAISQQECDLSARIERHQLELLKKKTTTTNHIRASCFIRSCMIRSDHVAVCSQNVTCDYIMRQTKNLAFIVIHQDG